MSVLTIQFRFKKHNLGDHCSSVNWSDIKSATHGMLSNINIMETKNSFISCIFVNVYQPDLVYEFMWLCYLLLHGNTIFTDDRCGSKPAYSTPLLSYEIKKCTTSPSIMNMS